MNLSTIPNFNRTRLAPTPSGFLHMGNAYSFLLTDALAKKKGAQLVLRIDDIDHIRKSDEYLKDIFETLNFLQISWQVGSASLEENTRFSQQQRKHNYEKLLQELRDRNLVYACDCSRSEIQKRTGSVDYDQHCKHLNLSLDAPHVAWRIAIPERMNVDMHDQTGETFVYEVPKDVRDFILKRRDGIPSYQLASFCDDLFFEIDFIIRGTDLFNSSIAQLALAQIIDSKRFLKTRFLHHEILKNEKGIKLSKSAGDLSLIYWRKNGMNRQDIIQHISEQLSVEAGKEFINLLQV